MAVEPWPYDKEAFRERNRIERPINKVKQFRRVATRYDKLDTSFLAFIKPALILIKVRSIVNRTQSLSAFVRKGEFTVKMA